MKQALGLVEIRGLSTAVVVADTMAKAADIRVLEIENSKGLGYMTIKIAGDVGAVNAAVNAGRQVGIANQKLVSSKVIPRPSDYVEHTFCDPKPLKTAAPSEQEQPVQAELHIEEAAKPEAPVRKPEEPKQPEVPAKAEKEPDEKEQEPAGITAAARKTDTAKHKK